MLKIEEIPVKMKALVLHNINDLRLEEVDVPKLQKDTVLLHIKNCGICSSDIERIFINGTYHFPTIPGHEFAGEIVAVNEENKELLGKKASVFPLMPCFNCDACKLEEYAQCSNYNYFGSRCDGAFSEYLVAPIWNLVIFDDLDYSLGALCEPASVALHAINRFEIQKDSKIFIMGSGTIGLLIATFLKAKGYDVTIGARKEKSIEFIKSLDIKVLNTNNFASELKSLTNNKGFDYIFEVIGTNESISKCIEASNNFAKIVLVGNPKDDLNIEKNIYWKVLRKQLTLTGTWNSNYNYSKNDWQEALEFMKKNQELFKKLITHKFGLEDYHKAFDLLKNKNEFKIKVMFNVE